MCCIFLPSCYKFTTDWLLVTKQSLLLDLIIDQSYLRSVSVVYDKFLMNAIIYPKSATTITNSINTLCLD